jgi:hypothetical protein
LARTGFLIKFYETEQDDCLLESSHSGAGR